jgi:hypothetical protein
MDITIESTYCIAPPLASLFLFVFNLQPRGAWGGSHGGASGRGLQPRAPHRWLSPLLVQVHINHLFNLILLSVVSRTSTFFVNIFSKY